jgi:hypothetical protein
LQRRDYALPVPQPLPRAYRRQLQVEDQAKLDRIIREAGGDEEPVNAAGATAPGDSRRLRGIPAVLDRGLHLEDQRHRAVVHQLDLHPRSEDARLDVDSLVAQGFHERPDDGFRLF